MSQREALLQRVKEDGYADGLLTQEELEPQIKKAKPCPEYLDILLGTKSTANRLGYLLRIAKNQIVDHQSLH